MKTQKTILCYGDSNTWGYVPISYDKQQLQRFNRSQRWTGLLQVMLGDEYYVIEEGLNSRTTNIDSLVAPYINGSSDLPINRNGMTYLPACLYSHAPIDLVILALGGNDLKASFKRSAEDVRDGLASLVEMIQKTKFGPLFQKPPQILLITQPPPLPLIEKFQDVNNDLIYAGMCEKAQLLIPLYKQLANEKHCHLLDISGEIIPSEIDGIHYDEQVHQKLAQLIYQKIAAIFMNYFKIK